MRQFVQTIFQKTALVPARRSADYTLSAATRQQFDREYETLKTILTDLRLTKPHSKD